MEEKDALIFAIIFALLGLIGLVLWFFLNWWIQFHRLNSYLQVDHADVENLKPRARQTTEDRQTSPLPSCTVKFEQETDTTTNEQQSSRSGLQIIHGSLENEILESVQDCVLKAPWKPDSSQLVGSFGIVRFGFLTRSGHVSESVCLKTAKSEERRKYLVNEDEIFILIGNRSDHIVRYIGKMRTENGLILLMEPWGKDMLTWLDLQRDAFGERDADVPLFLSVFEQVVDALQFLNGLGIIYRDLAARNVLLNEGIAKLCDFGASSQFIVQEDGKIALSGTIREIPDYVKPPELLSGEGETDRSDIWSFGIFTVEVFNYGADMMHSVISEKDVLNEYRHRERLVLPEWAPARMKALTDRCLSPIPSERPGFENVLEELREISLSE